VSRGSSPPVFLLYYQEALPTSAHCLKREERVILMAPPQDRAFVGNIVEATRAMTGRARTGRYPIVGSRGVIAVGSDGRMNTLAEARQDRWRGP